MEKKPKKLKISLRDPSGENAEVKLELSLPELGKFATH
jgi:hypothetical protein